MAIPKQAPALGGFTSGLVSTFAHEVAADIGGVTGPILTQAYSEIRRDWLDWNDIARARKMAYDLNVLSIDRNREFLDRQPVRFSVDQAVRAFNQYPWHRAYGNAAAAGDFWQRLSDNLAVNGVPVDRNQGNALGVGVEWGRLINMSCAAAPLDMVIRDYYRSVSLNQDQGGVSNEELLFNLQRAEFRRKEDRERLLKPFVSWSSDQWVELYWLGLLDFDQLKLKLRAAGVIWDEDFAYLQNLVAKRPEPDRLVQWAGRQLWSDEIAQHFGLDDGFDESPVARFFAQRQGLGAPQPALPGQPNGEADWLKLAYRDSRRVPDYGLARLLQHRLRPSADAPEQSVIDGVPSWTDRDTYHALRVEGFTERVINQLQALVFEPINIRLINHILGPYSTHPEVRAAAARAFGEGVDWVRGAMLDHGFSPAYAEVASVGIHAQAQDRDNAERKEHQKRQRETGLRIARDQYRIGMVSREQATAAMVYDQFTVDDAEVEVSLVDREVATGVAETQIKALHEAWMQGAFSADAILAAVLSLGITPARAAIYVTEWTWERTEKQRHLTTGEILMAYKDGMLAESAALERLLNLGWNQPDAILELAMIDKAHMQAELRAAQQEQTKAARAADQAARAAERRQKEAAKAGESQQKADAVLSLKVALALHKKLMQKSEYLAKLHAADVEYDKALKAGDENKQAIALNKEIAAYQRWLIEQTQLIAEAPEVAEVVGDVETQPEPSEPKAQSAPGNESGNGASAGNAGPSSSGP